MKENLRAPVVLSMKSEFLGQVRSGFETKKKRNSQETEELDVAE